MAVDLALVQRNLALVPLIKSAAVIRRPPETTGRPPQSIRRPPQSIRRPPESIRRPPGSTGPTHFPCFGPQNPKNCATSTHFLPFLRIRGPQPPRRPPLRAHTPPRRWQRNDTDNWECANERPHDKEAGIFPRTRAFCPTAWHLERKNFAESVKSFVPRQSPPPG